MFTDMSVSQDLNEKFNSYCKNDINTQLGIDFTILILQVSEIFYLNNQKFKLINVIYRLVHGQYHNQTC